jgi:predicted MFS family arabinose efflux permease
MATAAAGAVLAAFGVSGLVARLWWTRIADHQAKVTAVLWWLSAGAAGCTLLVWVAAWTWPAVIWLGAVGIGATATAGNAVSMLAVVRRGEAAGHASAMVSLGFFTGFVIGPATFGAVADAVGYGPSWIGVIVLFGLSAVVSVGIPAGSKLPQRTS